MASIIGVVKSVSDKNAKVVNNLTKEESPKCGRYTLAK